MESATLAKKSSKPAPTPRKTVALTVKGSEEWRDWVERVASHSRVSVSALVDVALAQWAKGQGVTEKPPER